MNDIHAIIAAAKRGETDIEYRELLHLRYNSIAMAEALARIAAPVTVSAMPCDIENDLRQRQIIARECLDKIEKEAKP